MNMVCGNLLMVKLLFLPFTFSIYFHHFYSTIFVEILYCFIFRMLFWRRKVFPGPPIRGKLHGIGAYAMFQTGKIFSDEFNFFWWILLMRVFLCVCFFLESKESLCLDAMRKLPPTDKPHLYDSSLSPAFSSRWKQTSSRKLLSRIIADPFHCCQQRTQSLLLMGPSSSKSIFLLDLPEVCGT